jgi:hypothetical protein
MLSKVMRELDGGKMTSDRDNLPRFFSEVVRELFFLDSVAGSPRKHILGAMERANEDQSFSREKMQLYPLIDRPVERATAFGRRFPGAQAARPDAVARDTDIESMSKRLFMRK